MEEKELNDKLKAAYDVIIAFQNWFEKNELHYMTDKKIETAMDKLLGEV
jgi:hypothetical protein